MNLKHFLFAFAALLSAAAVHISAQATRPGRDDAARPNDVRRNIPDFSTCGYAAGEQEIPHAGVCVVVPPRAGDNTARIQAAIDHVASLPSGEDGLRGAVLLEKGRHEVRGGLKISASGVVLRGSGHETELVAAGTDRRTLISIVGTDDRASGGTIAIAGDVAANATQFRFAGESNLKVGDEIEIRRPCRPFPGS